MRIPLAWRLCMSVFALLLFNLQHQVYVLQTFQTPIHQEIPVRGTTEIIQRASCGEFHTSLYSISGIMAFPSAGTKFDYVLSIKKHNLLQIKLVRTSTKPKSLVSLSDLVLPTTNPKNTRQKQYTYFDKKYMIYWFMNIVYSNSSFRLKLSVRKAYLLSTKNQFRRADFQAQLNRLPSITIIDSSFYILWENKRSVCSDLEKIKVVSYPSLSFSQKGGGKIKEVWTNVELQKFTEEVLLEGTYWFQSYSDIHSQQKEHTVVLDVPVKDLTTRLNHRALQKICDLHRITYSHRERVKSVYVQKLISHKCVVCPEFKSSFIFLQPTSPLSVNERRKLYNAKLDNNKNLALKEKDKIRKRVARKESKSKFPPTILTTKERNTIIANFINDTDIKNLKEEGCAVCGCLVLSSALLNLADHKHLLNPLTRPEVTRKERHTDSEPIQCLPGPVLASKCDKICVECLNALKRHEMPRLSLANGLWLGDIPSQLSELSWMEKKLVARVASSEAVIRIHKSQLYKMKCNVVCNAVPIRKIYDILPPPVSDIEDVIAAIFISPNAPIEEDFRKIPLLIRRNKVAAALEWLKRNHEDYAELQISYKNLEEYPEDVPPIAVDFHPTTHDCNLESRAVNEQGDEYATSEGDVPFVVHGLTSEQLTEMLENNPKQAHFKALRHFNEGHKMLGIGTSSKPESLWNNPQLYPSMFPWLFPY